jgi:hypothetical protein
MQDDVISVAQPRQQRVLLLWWSSIQVSTQIFPSTESELLQVLESRCCKERIT